MRNAELVFYQWPVRGAPRNIEGGFGEWYGTYRHRGIDFGVTIGTRVEAPAPGRVVAFSNDGSFGIGVCLDHETKPFRYSLYAHLSVAVVSPGARVEVGDLLGYSGNTGKSSGPHLHWQLCKNTYFPREIEQSADPTRYLQEDSPMTPAEKEAFDRLLASHNRLLRNIFGVKGENLILSQIQAEALSQALEDAMMAGSHVSLGEDLRGHLDDRAAHRREG